MEETQSQMKHFLKSFNQQIQSPTSEELPSIRVVNYNLDLAEIPGQVIDWILSYLENSKSNCPYPLALAIAKEAAHQVSASFAEVVASNASEKELEKYSSSSNIYAEALGKLSSICVSFLENDTFLDRINQDSLPSDKCATSVFAIKNKRRKMEDRHVVHHDLNALLDLKDAPLQSFFAVFDGHSGAEAACYSSAQLHINIAKHPQFLLDTPRAIIEGFHITDMNFLNKCNQSNLKSGCTVISALLREKTLYLAWCGDSQAILVKGGLPVLITSPHKPEREDEQARIESLGGHISHHGTWRVNGLLAVTRAIGDPDQKMFISSEPELSVIDLDGTEDFLILACDGLWDGISPEDVTAVLYRHLMDSCPNENLDSVAAKLVHQSKLQGSEDNITAIVIFLRDPKIIKENAVKFMSNDSLLVQGQDFLSMNGNSSAPFEKPTVLELNATSTKKLKNAANVMSSAGFGDASFNYQYVENTMMDSFQYQKSALKESRDMMASRQQVASCVAPEKTALSELPTPPIDDMLASQHCDSFYSTDLYKEMKSMTDEQNVSVVESYLGGEKSAYPAVAEAGGATLLDHKLGAGSSHFPEEALDIASAVVSDTIENAVKCLDEEAIDIVSAQSPVKLNPYAKPFVMKSFMSPDNTEEPTAASTNPFDFGNQDILPKSELNVAGDVQAMASNLCAENPKENVPLEISPVVLESMKDNLQLNVGTKASESLEHKAVTPTFINDAGSVESAFPQENVFTSVSAKKEISSGAEVCSNKVLEQVSMNSNTAFKNNPAGSNFVNNLLSPHSSPDKMPSPVLENNLILISEQEMMSEASTLDDITSSLSHDFEYMNLNSGLGMVPRNFSNDQVIDQLSTPMLDQNIDFGFSSDISEKDAVEVTTPVASNKLDDDQNIVLCKASDESSVPKDVANNKAVEEKFVGVKEMEKIEAPDSSHLPEKVSKEPISLVTITNELLSANAEIPSDPSAEDSHIEPVAVDLKSLPENIPEADGVTEDVDSDSEKDGGWSYMKGQALSGSKPKSGEKTSKSSKSATLKTAALKPKKDVPKFTLDSRSKIKGSASEKSKILSTLEKSKASAVDKTKSISSSIRSATTSRVRITTSTPKVGSMSAERKFETKASKPTLSAIKVNNVKDIQDRNALDKKENPDSRAKTASAKPSRPATLLRTAKPAPATTDKSAVPSKNRSTPTVPLKSKPSTLSENKTTNVKTTSASNNTLKRLPSTQSKATTTTTAVRNVTARLTTTASRNITARSTVASSASTISRSAVQSKSAVTEAKPRQLASSTLPKRPISSGLSKPDVKEVKDTVNKQISARRNVAPTTMPSSSSTVGKRVPSTISRSTAGKTLSNNAKPTVSKKDVPKAQPSKVIRNPSVKSSQVISKNTKEEIVPNKTDDEKNTLNLDVEEKHSEVVQATEKYVLEANNREIVLKENEVDFTPDKEVAGTHLEMPEKISPVEDNLQEKILEGNLQERILEDNLQEKTTLAEDNLQINQCSESNL